MKHLSRALLGILGTVLLTSSPAGFAADPSSCLRQEDAARLLPQLRYLVQHRQALIPAAEYTEDVFKQIQENYRAAFIALHRTKLSKENLGCLGFKLKLRRIHPSLTDDLIGRLLPAFLLLDDSMLPRALRADESRPDHFERKVGKWIQITERFRFTKNAAGVYHNGTKRITYPLFLFDHPSWPVHLRTHFLESGVIHTPHGGWNHWNCKYTSPLDEGSFGVFLHEYGHDLDYALKGILWNWDPGLYSSSTKSWKELHQKEFTSPYGNTSLVEDFAETFTAFLLDPLLKCYAPGKYAWFARFTKVNAAVYGSTLPFEGVDCSTPALRELVAERKNAGDTIRACPKKKRKD